MEVFFQPHHVTLHLHHGSAELRVGPVDEPGGRAPASIWNGAELVTERRRMKSYMLAGFVWMGLISSAHIPLPEKGLQACLSSMAKCCLATWNVPVGVKDKPRSHAMLPQRPVLSLSFSLCFFKVGP